MPKNLGSPTPYNKSEIKNKTTPSQKKEKQTIASNTNTMDNQKGIKSIDNNILGFIEYAEKAFGLNNEIDNAYSTYITLFNSYLTLSENNKDYFQKAANNLYKAYLLNPKISILVIQYGYLIFI